MKNANEPFVLWLPSWYPNKREPYNGDFIQRHARAASMHHRITVLFFTQYGEKVKTKREVTERREGNLREIVVYVPFKPTGFSLFDRIAYNFSFYRFSKKFLKAYFKQEGLPSVTHVHVPVKAGNLALWIKKKFGIPYLVSEQSSTYLKAAPDNFFKRNRYYRSRVKKIFSNAVAVTNVSRAVGKILCGLFALKRLTVIHNVVDASLFNRSPQFSKTFTYIHVSSLSEQKNIVAILRTFKRLSAVRKDWKLIVVGPCTEELRRYAAAEGLNAFVSFTGEIPYAGVARHLQRARVMVLFSKHENFPCVVVEALCCGLVVVSSDVAGIGEAVNALNGILVEPENEEALLEALLKIREAYAAYDSVSIAEEAQKRFGYPAIARDFDNLYKSVGVGS